MKFEETCRNFVHRRRVSCAQFGWNWFHSRHSREPHCFIFGHAAEFKDVGPISCGKFPLWCLCAYHSSNFLGFSRPPWKRKRKRGTSVKCPCILLLIKFGFNPHPSVSPACKCDFSAIIWKWKPNQSFLASLMHLEVWRARRAKCDPTWWTGSYNWILYFIGPKCFLIFSFLLLLLSNRVACIKKQL